MSFWQKFFNFGQNDFCRNRNYLGLLPEMEYDCAVDTSAWMIHFYIIAISRTGAWVASLIFMGTTKIFAPAAGQHFWRWRCFLPGICQPPKLSGGWGSRFFLFSQDRSLFPVRQYFSLKAFPRLTDECSEICGRSGIFPEFPKIYPSRYKKLPAKAEALARAVFQIFQWYGIAK